MRNLVKVLSLTAVAMMALSGCGSTDKENEQKHSGFLSDYSVLENHDSDDDANLMRWIKSDVDFSQYKSFMVEPIDFYPSLPSSAQIPDSVLKEIKDYYNSSMQTAFSEVLPLTDKATEDTMRVRMAITAMTIDDKELSAYQYIPIAFLVTAASGGLSDMSLKIMVESELSNAKTGEVLASGVKSGAGETLENEDVQLTFEMAKPLIDEWVATSKKGLLQYIK